MTKARQWKRPTEPASSTETSATTSNPADAISDKPATASSSSDISSTLSPKKIDIVDNYRQSKRFTSIRLSAEALQAAGVTTPVNEQANESNNEDSAEDKAAASRAAARASLRLSRAMLKPITELIAAESTSTEVDSSVVEKSGSGEKPSTAIVPATVKGPKYFALQRIQQSRDRYNYVVDTMELCHTEAEWEAELADFKQTIPYLYAFGQKKYTGYLNKQSKLLGRWKKRFFILQDEYLYYLDSEKEYQQMVTKYGAKEWKNKLKADKTLLLTDQTLASYTTTPNCLSITTSVHAKDANNDELTWFLLADNDE